MTLKLKVKIFKKNYKFKVKSQIYINLKIKKNQYLGKCSNKIIFT
jgi:hypothetical protein